jgi:hypothetical protein
MYSVSPIDVCFKLVGEPKPTFVENQLAQDIACFSSRRNRRKEKLDVKKWRENVAKS